MAALILPLDSDTPHSRRSVQLEGASFLVDLDWNGRDAAWYFSLRLDDEAASPLLEGFRVVIGASPLRRLRDPRRPPGDILFVDTSGAQQDPGRDELGGRVVALYTDRADIDALLADLAGG